MNLFKILALITITCFIMLVSGCTGKIYRAARSNINQTEQRIAHLEAKNQLTAPAVVFHPGYYVDTNPVIKKHQPEWLSKKVRLIAENLPFDILMNRLLRQSDVGVSYDNTVARQRLVSLDYSGTIQGALDRLAAQTHYYYSLNNKELFWSAFETKTFNIAFMPGASNYLVGQTESTDTFSHTNTTGTTTVVSTGGLNDQQYSNLHGELSVWDDIYHTLNEIKSKQGKVVVSESTTSVTVYDHPEKVAEMEQYIKQLNRSLAKEVGIKVEVLEIDLDRNFNNGIDWNAIWNMLNTEFKVTGNLATATNPLSSTLIQDSATSPLATFQIGEGQERTLIAALSQQGKLRVVTQPQVITMNDQIASIRITQNTGFIQSVSSTTFGTSGEFVTSSITPGNVTDGFTLYLLPRIQHNNVYLQISSTISNLLSLQKETTSTGDSDNQQFNAIEVPTIAQKAFNQRSVVRSGATLIIAGFKRMRDQTNKAAMFGVEQLGGKGAQRQDTETLILITPIILQSTGQWNGNSNS